MRILRTNNANPDFIALIKLLDANLAISDGDEHDFYDQYNKVDTIKHVIVGYIDDRPVGCGALKEFDSDTMEVKRMFTAEGERGKGIAISILETLELWAKELQYKKCILETGLKQPAAIQLYKKTGYQIIPNYGQYSGVQNSVCFEKQL
jgi:putative acetyltransferase